MLTAAMLVLLAAEPETAEEGLAIFTAPIAPLVGAAFAAFPDQPPIVFVPLGAAFTALDAEWHVDVALVQQQSNRHPQMTLLAIVPPIVGSRGFYGTWLSLGPVLHSGTHGLNGFFVSPRLVLGAFFVDNLIMGEVLAGFDAGYQVTFGPWYFAFVFGASIGVGTNENDEWAGPLIDPSLPPRKDTVGFVGGLNLQLFRIGYIF